MSEEKKCCKSFNIIVVILLVLNTFLLAGILCTLKCKAGSCMMSGSKGKICPITGKSLEDYKGPQQGS